MVWPSANLQNKQIHSFRWRASLLGGICVASRYRQLAIGNGACLGFARRVAHRAVSCVSGFTSGHRHRMYGSAAERLFDDRQVLGSNPVALCAHPENVLPVTHSRDIVSFARARQLQSSSRKRVGRAVTHAWVRPRTALPSG